MEQINKELNALREVLEDPKLQKLNDQILRDHAKRIAAIGCEHFKDELLDRTLDVSKALVAMAEELVNPS